MFHSQDNQDTYLEKYVFKGYKDGFFVDVGAHDGLSINNTVYFEKNNNWKGLNIEPLKEVYDKLIVNRPSCININCAVCNNDGETEFVCNTGPTEMLSGIKHTYDKRHIQRIQSENEKYGSSSTVITVQTKKLETLFDNHDVKHVNYLSIDVEGGEFEVIKSINFDKVFIDLIGFENNYHDSSVPIVDYLKTKNYVRIRLPCPDIFMIHKNSIFIKNIKNRLFCR